MENKQKCKYKQEQKHYISFEKNAPKNHSHLRVSSQNHTIAINHYYCRNAYAHKHKTVTISSSIHIRTSLCNIKATLLL